MNHVLGHVANMAFTHNLSYSEIKRIGWANGVSCFVVAEPEGKLCGGLCLAGVDCECLSPDFEGGDLVEERF